MAAMLAEIISKSRMLLPRPLEEEWQRRPRSARQPVRVVAGMANKIARKCRTDRRLVATRRARGKSGVVRGGYYTAITRLPPTVPLFELLTTPSCEVVEARV